MDVTTEIRRGSARFVSRSPGMVTHHSFSFGEHYDPERLRFGPMVCHDDHHLGSGKGFDAHRHSGLDIVTWVVDGRLRHRHAEEGGDELGPETVLEPGQVAVLSTGSGVAHSEHAGEEGRARFVQVWLASDRPGPPSYDVRPVAPQVGSLVEVVSPQPGATLHLARLGSQQSLALPAAPRVHVYVVTGALVRSSLAEPLSAGDAFLFTDEPTHEVVAAVPTDLLVWTFDD